MPGGAGMDEAVQCGLNSLTDIANVSFGLTRAHAMAELQKADTRLLFFISTMLASVGLAVTVIVYMQKHIVGPLKSITSSITTIVTGQRAGPNPRIAGTRSASSPEVSSAAPAHRRAQARRNPSCGTPQ